MDVRVSSILARLPTYFSPESVLIIADDEPNDFFRFIAAIFEGIHIYAIGGEEETDGFRIVSSLSMAIGRAKRDGITSFDLIIIASGSLDSVTKTVDTIHKHISKEGIGLLILDKPNPALIKALNAKKLKVKNESTAWVDSDIYPLDEKIILVCR